MAAAFRLVRGALLSALAAVTILWVAFPFWWAIIFSVKREADFFGSTLVPFLQFRPTLANWRTEWAILFNQAGLGFGLVNSFVVASTATGLSLVLGLLAAVGLLRCQRDRVPIWPFVALFLLPRVVPSVILAFPFSTIMRRVHLGDTDAALVIAHTTLALPLTILLLFSMLRELPPAVLEAAQLDGATWWRLVRQIVVPLIRPALLAAGTLTFALSWDEYLFAVTNSQVHAATAPLAILSLESREGVEFAYVGSHLVAVLLPPLILVLAAQRFVVRGLTLGAVRD